MCCTRLAGNTGCKNDAKNRHLRTTAQLCQAVSLQLRHVSTIGKNLLNSNMSSTCLHNMANFGPLMGEIGSGVWGIPGKFRRVSCLAFATAVTSLNGGQPKFARCLAISWAGALYIHFRGLLPPSRILPSAKFTLCLSLALAYIGSITARHSSSGRQPNFAVSYKEWNYRTFAEGASTTYVQQGGHHVGHWPTF